MFGSHLSIAGGLHNAATSAQSLGMDTVQIFPKNQQQWKAKPLDPAAIEAWRSHCARLNFAHTVSHDSYLINLASPDDALWQKSIDLFVEELARCTLLGIPYLVTHPGAHVGSGEDAGLKRVAKGLDEVHNRLPRSAASRRDALPQVITCLEITAGQGTCLGHRLEHLATIIDLAKNPDPLPSCPDTAHLFAADSD